MKPTYEDLEKQIHELKRQLSAFKEEPGTSKRPALPSHPAAIGEGRSVDSIRVSSIDMEWQIGDGIFTFEKLPAAMMWVDTTLAGLMSGMQAMVGPERFWLASQSEGRRSVEADWQVISRFQGFAEGFAAIANIAAVAGWGVWTLVSMDLTEKQCHFQVRGSWEGQYQRALGVCWGSGMLAGKMAGYCSRLFNTNCWAEQTRFAAKGDDYDEFLVAPSQKTVEEELDKLLLTDRASRADMAVALKKLETEIVERKRVEESLRESEERFRELAELLPETIFETDTAGNLTFVNRNAFVHFSFSPEDFERGLNGFEMVSAEDRPRIMENASRVMNGEKIGLNEYKALRKDGSTFPVIIHSAAKLRGEKPAGLRGIVIDITETKKLEAQLRQAHKMEAIGTLAGGIAHDFNNILAAIIGYTEMALTDVSESSVTRHYLEQVLNAGQRAKDLVKQILASSRQQQSQERLPVEIAPVITEALKLLRASLPTTIEIRQHIVSATDVALADPIEIHQVLVNLCTNAAHAMEERGGVLEVRLDEMTVDSDAAAALAELTPGPYLRLTVSDNGHGMDATTLERIFDPYFTTKELGRSTGLGLTVVHGIVKRHQGAITVNSEPGVGTSFHAYFPKAESGTAKEFNAAEKSILKGTERILFVDDEETLVEMEKSMLDWLGYKVSATTSSVEALELFRTQPNRFDIVITDYTMPHMTGVDLAKEMLRIRPDIPVILCTGFSERITEEKAREMGIRAFAMKPLELHEISAIIRRVLDKGGA